MFTNMATCRSFLRFLVVVNIFSVCAAVNTLTVVLDSIEKLIDYYKINVKEMNVDGLFGLRVLEGQVSMVLDKMKHDVPDEVRNRLSGFLRVATMVAQEGVKLISKHDVEYFRAMYPIVAQPWTFWKSDRMVDKSKKWSIAEYDRIKAQKFEERTSDMCMSEIMGTQESHSKTCSISPNCTLLMTARGHAHYGITHQILWTMLAERSGCLSELTLAVHAHTTFKSVDELRTEFCTNNYYEMVAMVEEYMKGIVYPDLQDIFLEQQFVCPGAGFGEFLNRRYLSQIVSWQHSNGCYGDHKPASPNEQMPPTFNKQYVKLILDIKKHRERERERKQDDWEIEQPVRQRALLAEKEMLDGCLAHKTAVAAGALSMYLRYLLIPSLSHDHGNVESDRLSINQHIPADELVDKFEKIEHQDETERNHRAGKSGLKHESEDAILAKSHKLKFKRSNRNKVGDNVDDNSYKYNKRKFYRENSDKDDDDKDEYIKGNLKRERENLNGDGHKNGNLDNDFDGDFAHYNDGSEGKSVKDKRVREFMDKLSKERVKIVNRRNVKSESSPISRGKLRWLFVVTFLGLIVLLVVRCLKVRRIQFVGMRQLMKHVCRR